MKIETESAGDMIILGIEGTLDTATAWTFTYDGPLVASPMSFTKGAATIGVAFSGLVGDFGVTDLTPRNHMWHFVGGGTALVMSGSPLPVDTFWEAKVSAGIFFLAAAQVAP